MKAFKYLLATFALTPYVSAQGQFEKPENSDVVLAALKQVNNATVRSANAAKAFKANDAPLREALINENVLLRANWQTVIFFAQSENGFYSPKGAQAIIDYINNHLYPSTRDADVIYVKKRDVFVKSGFIKFINPGLLQLRMAVDAASSNVQARTSAAFLQAMTVAFTQIETDYARTQEIQMYGPKEDLVLQAGDL